MRRQQRRWAGALVLAAAAADLLLSGRLSAQGSGQGMGTPGQATAHADEAAPRLFAGPDGEVFRLWERWADFRTGGGGVFLAAASPGDSWKTLLEILPKEPGVNALD